MAKLISITQFNRGIAINNTFVDETGKAKILTGYTCNVDVVYPDKTKENISVEIVNSLTGNVLFILGLLQTTKPGIHELYFNLTDINSFVTAQNVIRYNVISETGGA